MSSTRSLLRVSSLALRSARLVVPRLAPILRPSAVSRPFSSTPLALKEARHTSAAWASSEKVEYPELKKITQSPDDSILLIDVREPNEVALGSIPSSVNLPLSSFEKSLSMDEGDFTRVHGFHKPDKTQQIIFYCRSGKRSETAIDLAKRAGFRALRNYEGSYTDWAAKDAKSDD